MNILGNIRPKPEWTANLCGCGADCGTCFITCFTPCVTFGRIAEVVDDGNSSCVTQGCVYGLLMLVSSEWLISCIYREKLRAKFGLPNEPCCDCCVHFCCERCALCQEYDELKNRGYDPAKGVNSSATARPWVQRVMER